MTYREIRDPIYRPGPHDGLAPPIGVVVTVEYEDGDVAFRLEQGGSEAWYETYSEASDTAVSRWMDQ